MISKGLNHDALVYAVGRAFEDELRAALRAQLQPLVDQAIEEATQGIKLRVASMFRPEAFGEEVRIVVTDKREKPIV